MDEDETSDTEMEMGQRTFIEGTGDGQKMLFGSALCFSENTIPVLILVTKHGQDGLLQLENVVPHMFLLNHEDPDQRLKITVKLGKDMSPSMLLEHMMHNHNQEYYYLL